MLSFAAYSSARVQQISPTSARTECNASPFAEDSFDGLADPVITSNPAVAHVGGPQSLPSGQPFVQNRRIRCAPKLLRSGSIGKHKQTRGGHQPENADADSKANGTRRSSGAKGVSGCAAESGIQAHRSRPYAQRRLLRRLVMGSWKSLEGRGGAGQIRQEGEDGGRVIDFTKPERHQMFQIV